MFILLENLSKGMKYFVNAEKHLSYNKEESKKSVMTMLFELGRSCHWRIKHDGQYVLGRRKREKVKETHQAHQMNKLQRNL